MNHLSHLFSSCNCILTLFLGIIRFDFDGGYSFKLLKVLLSVGDPLVPEVTCIGERSLADSITSI
ncbi:hypothetical protein TorRG33x02_013240 [Trema orientale]|uniref:Uncharacterized protein n=1 Tax=Trema orientale TaxID=63057 RepID=A0A2P5FZP0_TREOI|nr:hypothetical protein TorRG33x02_013240 [Trema orientale]